MRVTITVNGTTRETEVEPRTLLVDYLRDDLALSGTNIGCDTSQCGACTVHLDGQPVKSCTILAVQADGSSVTTIEGLSGNDGLHPMQAAFREMHGLQCGFCTSGMIMAAVKLVEDGGDLSDRGIRERLEGNLCRCTGYENIVRSIRHYAREVESHAPLEGDEAKPHHRTLLEAEELAARRQS
ncbi:MAG: (2Fe-2S)-binding protein [Acidimicrobiia bacterium]|nr:(2Fe-2S)-binding protein [Acidimicrobiia bacterium]